MNDAGGQAVAALKRMTDMSSKKREQRPEARLPKGMRDIEAAEIRGVERMLRTIREVYESYGFEPLDTPAFEYTDALGKFLPDQDRPNEGVFSFQDEDDEWLSLRYDLTAPLARYVAQNFDGLPKPFRRYQTGPVWRNEKPGPGRFRQFTQFDADTVGTDSVAADAEMCMLAADTLEALGIPRGNYAINISNRKILDGLLEIIGLNPSADESIRVRNAVLRALDKLDKFPPEEIELLLGVGRLDESGDFTKGAGLASNQIKTLLNFVYKAREHFEPREQMRERGKLRTEDELVDENDWVLDVTSMLADWSKQLQSSAIGSEGVEELRQMQEIWWCSGYGSNRIRPNANIVRGLEYYTGPIFEADLGFETIDSAGKNARFGSVGGGGRYDGLVSRFKGTKIPATGFSIGVSRLYAALQALGKLKTDAAAGPVVVLVMDKERVADYNRMARALREAGIRAEMYLGTSGMKAQMKYADKRGAPCVVIQGGDEREHPDGPRVTIKDLIEGERLAAEISDNQEWREGRPAQFSVKEGELVEAVRSVLARHGK